MAECVHHPAHPAPPETHDMDQNSLLRRKSREAGGREGMDGGLAGHLERLSKQLDNIQAEHSQLFHNRHPDRENLAKSTARFLSHNGRQNSSSRPAAIDQADISLQAAAAVSASSRRSSYANANAPPPSRKGSMGVSATGSEGAGSGVGGTSMGGGGSGTGGSPDSSTPPSPRPSSSRPPAYHSSKGEQDLRRCQSATSCMPAFTQAPAPVPSSSPAPGAGSAARRLHWQEPTQGAEQHHHQHQQHTHTHAHSRFAAEHQHGRALEGGAAPLGLHPSSAACASPTRSSSSSSSSTASAVSGASLRQLLPQEGKAVGQHGISGSGSSGASSVSTEESLQGGHPGPPPNAQQQQQQQLQEQGALAAQPPSQGYTFPTHHALPQPSHPPFTPPLPQQQQQQQHATANKMRMLPADGLLSPASSSADTGGIAAAVGSECSYSSSSSGSGSGSTVRSEAAAQREQQGADGAPDAGRAAATAGALNGDEAEGPLRNQQQPLNSSFTQAGSGISARSSGSGGAGRYTGGGDLASRMAAGRARRALRNARATQRHSESDLVAPPAAAVAAPAAAVAGGNVFAGSGVTAQPEDGTRAEGCEDGDQHQPQQQQQQQGTYVPSAAGMPPVHKLPLHTEDWQQQQQQPGMQCIPLPSSSRVRTARQSVQGYAGGDAGRGGSEGTRQQEEEEERALADQGHARKRHRVSELPDTAALHGHGGGYGMFSGRENSAEGGDVHGRLPSRGDGDSGGGSGCYVGWAPTLPPVSHALDPCPNSPSPCSSSSPPTGTMSPEDAPASQQGLHESTSLLPSRSSSEESRTKQPQQQLLEQQQQQQQEQEQQQQEQQQQQRQEQQQQQEQEQQQQHEQVRQQQQQRQQQQKSEQDEGKDQQLLLSLALEQQQQQQQHSQEGQRPGTPTSHPDASLLSLVAQLRQQHAQRLRNGGGVAGGSGGVRVSKPRSEASDPPVLQVSAPVHPEGPPPQSILQPAPVRAPPPAARQQQQLRQQQQQDLPLELLQQQQQDLPLELLQQQQQEHQAPSPPRGHLSRFQADDSVLFGSPIRRPDSATAASSASTLGASVSPGTKPLRAAAATAPYNTVANTAGASSAAETSAHAAAVPLAGAPAPVTTANVAPSATAATAATSATATQLWQQQDTAAVAATATVTPPVDPMPPVGLRDQRTTAAGSYAENYRATLRSAETRASAAYQPEPRVVLYEPSRYQDEEAEEEEDKPTGVGQQQPHGTPALDAGVDEQMRMSLTLQPGQLAGFDLSPTRGELQQRHHHHHQEQQQQQQPAPVIAHFSLAEAVPETAASTPPPPPLPEPTTWRAGERPLASPQKNLHTRGSHALPFSPSQPHPSGASKQAAHLSSPPPQVHSGHFSAASTPYASPYAAPSDMSIPGTHDDHVPATPYAACSDLSMPTTPMTDATRLLSPSQPTPQACSSSPVEQSSGRADGQEQQAACAAGGAAEVPSASITGHPIFSVAGSGTASAADGDAAGSGVATAAAAAVTTDAAGGARAPEGRGRNDLPRSLPGRKGGSPYLQLPHQEETLQGHTFAFHGRSPSPSASHDSRRSSKLFQLKERRQHQHGWEVWRHRSHSPSHSSLSPSASPSPSPPSQTHPQHAQHAHNLQAPTFPAHPSQPKDPSAHPSQPTDQQNHQGQPSPIPSFGHSQQGTAAPHHLPQNLDLGHGPLGLSTSYPSPCRSGSRDESPGAGTGTGGYESGGESGGKAWLPRVGAPIDSPPDLQASQEGSHQSSGEGAGAAAQDAPGLSPTGSPAIQVAATAAADQPGGEWGSCNGLSLPSPTAGSSPLELGHTTHGKVGNPNSTPASHPTFGLPARTNPNSPAPQSPHLTPPAPPSPTSGTPAAPSITPEPFGVAASSPSFSMKCPSAIPTMGGTQSMAPPARGGHTQGHTMGSSTGGDVGSTGGASNISIAPPIIVGRGSADRMPGGRSSGGASNINANASSGSSSPAAVQAPRQEQQQQQQAGRGSADRMPAGRSSGGASNINTNASSGSSSPAAVQPWQEQQQQVLRMQHGEQHSYDGDAGQPDRMIHFRGPHSHSFSHSPEGRPSPVYAGSGGASGTHQQPPTQQQQQQLFMRHGEQHSYDGDAEQPDRVMHFRGPHSHSFSHSPEGRPSSVSAGSGGASGTHQQLPTQQQEQEQQQRQQLHAVKRSAALLRLKQQCIQRHQPIAAAAAAASGAGIPQGGGGNGGSQYGVADDGAAGQSGLTDEEGGSCSLRRASRAAEGKRAAVGNLLGRLHEHRSARPVTPPAARPDSTPGTSDSAAYAEVGTEGAGHVRSHDEERPGGDEGNESPDMTTPKPFLRRKSRKVVGSKIDWSHVKPRTVSRLDYTYNPYTNQSADLSPPWSHNKQGVGKAKQQRAASRNSPTKQSQNLGSAGPKPRTRSAARAATSVVRDSSDSWRPTRQDRPSAGAVRSSTSSNAARSPTGGTRPRGVLPGADYECVRYTGIPYPSGNHLLTRPLSAGMGPDVNKSGTDQQLRTPPRSKGARGAAQAGVPGSPLDDLLVHVNSLLKDFDTRFAASSTPSRSGAVRGVPVTNFSVERANDVD